MFNQIIFTLSSFIFLLSLSCIRAMKATQIYISYVTKKALTIYILIKIYVVLLILFLTWATFNYLVGPVAWG